MIPERVLKEKYKQTPAGPVHGLEWRKKHHKSIIENLHAKILNVIIFFSFSGSLLPEAGFWIFKVGDYFMASTTIWSHHKLSSRWYFLASNACDSTLPRNTIANVHYLLYRFFFAIHANDAQCRCLERRDFVVFATFSLQMHFQRKGVNVFTHHREEKKNWNSKSEFIKCSFRFIWVARCWDSITISAWPRYFFFLIDIHLQKTKGPYHLPRSIVHNIHF